VRDKSSDQSAFFGNALADHVPRTLVRPISWFATDPFTLVRSLRDEAPMIYTLRNPMLGQSWDRRADRSSGRSR